jgi:quercetin dioxygenase-like cupin family protein
VTIDDPGTTRENLILNAAFRLTTNRWPLIAENQMELIRAAEVNQFSNSGVTSRQLLSPENSRSTRITITRVIVTPGAKNPPHRHAMFEQVWIALRGSGQLLLDEGKLIAFAEGDIVRFEDGDLHGFENTTSSDFEYLSVTSPPVNFRAAYEKEWSPQDTK